MKKLTGKNLEKENLIFSKNFFLDKAKENLRKSLEQPLTSKELKEYNNEYEKLIKKQRSKFI